MVKSKSVPKCVGDVVALPTADVVFTHAKYAKMSGDVLTLRPDQSSCSVTNPARVARLSAHHRGAYTTSFA